MKLIAVNHTKNGYGIESTVMINPAAISTVEADEFDSSITIITMVCGRKLNIPTRLNEVLEFLIDEGV